MPIPENILTHSCVTPQGLITALVSGGFWSSHVFSGRYLLAGENKALR